MPRLAVILVLSVYLDAAARTQPPVPPVVSIPSGSAVMFGASYAAEGPGPHPTVLLLHGHPGGSLLGRSGATSNVLELAYPLQRAGFNVVVFNFRGAWGSGGTYGFPHRIEDVKAAVEFVRNDAARLKAATGKISLVGHSAGGFNALVASVEDSSIRCTVGIAPANYGPILAGPLKKAAEATAGTPAVEDSELDRPTPGLGGYTGRDAVREILANQPRFDVASRMAPLKGRPLLIVQANQDVIIRAPNVAQYVEAARAAGAAPFDHVQIDADHNFGSDGSRKELADAVVGWMTKHCK